MKSPVVSVCIANFNGLSIISSCLESVLAQEGDIPTEIIVHDDASTDGSVEFLQKNYPEITLLASEQNAGFCVANNRMAKITEGEYLLLLNNDAALFPDALITLLAKARDIGSPAILGLPQYDADTGELLDRGSLLDPFLNPIPNLDPSRTRVGMIMGACLWIPKKLWVELDGFPEWFGSIGEDLYLGCRARLAGYEVQVLPHSGYRHKVGQSFGGGKVTSSGLLRTSQRRRALSEINKTYTMAVTYPTALLMIIMPIHLLILYLEGLILTLLKLQKEIFTAIYFPIVPLLWQHRDRLMQIRKNIQSQKRISLLTWLNVFKPYPHKLKLLLKHRLPDIQ